MSVTSVGPAIGSGSFWNKLGDFALDVGRHRLIDVERAADTNNVPDRTDVRTGEVSASIAPTGNVKVPAAMWIAGGVAGIALLALLIKR